MSEISGVNSVLAQIRALRSQIDGPMAGAGAGASAGSIAGTAATTPGASFTSAMTKAVDQVSQSQDKANALAEAFEKGDRNTSIAQVMLSMQKAQVEFKALAEVRNRLVQAYQDIQNMPL